MGKHYKPDSLTIIYNGGEVWSGLVDSMRCTEHIDGRVELRATEYQPERYADQ